MTTVVTTITPAPIKPDVPLWLTGHQCPRVEYLPTSEYKLKRGEKTGWGVVCQYASRRQKEMNAIYVGGLEERNAEGYGEWHSEEEGMSYHGGWKGNLANGYGRYCDSWLENWPDGWTRFIPDDAEGGEPKHTYEGGFKEGYFHGYGVLTFRNKSKYEGTWKDGRRWGYGKYLKDNGSVMEFQFQGAVKKPEPKKEEPKKPPPPQVVYVQQQPQPPQLLQPVVVQSPPTPQPILVTPASQGHEHQANAGVQVAWAHGQGPEHQANVGGQVNWGHGHGSPGQQQAQPGYFYQPVPYDMNQHRPSTPQPMPVQFSYPPRPVTPQPRPNDQTYIYAVPSAAQPGVPGSPPYPDITPINLSGSPGGSPSNTGYLPHM